jgi:hypothetical protein
MRQYSRTSLDYLSRFVFWTKSRRQVVRTGRLYHWRLRTPNKNRSYVTHRTYFPKPIQFLTNTGVLPVQRLAQTREVRIESYKPVCALEERASAGLPADAIERTLSITRRQITVTGQSD